MEAVEKVKRAISVVHGIVEDAFGEAQAIAPFCVFFGDDGRVVGMIDLDGVIEHIVNGDTSEVKSFIRVTAAQLNANVSVFVSAGVERIFEFKKSEDLAAAAAKAKADPTIPTKLIALYKAEMKVPGALPARCLAMSPVKTEGGRRHLCGLTYQDRDLRGGRMDGLADDLGFNVFV